MKKPKRRISILSLARKILRVPLRILDWKKRRSDKRGPPRPSPYHR